MRAVSWIWVAVLGCAGAAGDAPELAGAGGVVDAGAPLAASPDAGCGLSFEQARDAFAPERVCQTTVYDRVTGYCTFWQPCSGL